MRLQRRGATPSFDNRTMLRLPPLRRRSLSCGILVLLETHELLLCHVTGQRQWDLPKGGIQVGETECEAWAAAMSTDMARRSRRVMPAWFRWMRTCRTRRRTRCNSE